MTEHDPVPPPQPAADPRAAQGAGRPPGGPPWWPQGEPWPPAGRAHWRGTRGHFLRRLGCGVAALTIGMGGLFLALFWLISSSLRLLSIPDGLRGSFGLVALLGLVFGLGGLWLAGRAVRRTVIPFGNLLEAADRIAGGDYTARVAVEAGGGAVRGLARAFNSMAARLEANDRQRRALLADVTHELRTPLTIVQGNLEGMLDGIYPADAAHLQAVLEETHVLSRVIDDLRTLSLAEAGALNLQRQPADLLALVEDTASAFQSQAQQAAVTLRVSAPAGLPEVSIDPTRIREVLENLLSNALRHTPVGGQVQVRIEPQPGQVRVSVADSGPGIPAADLPHIFDRFYKSADSRGSGLGLAIARSLVAAHGGEIQAESPPGQGARIWFSLPNASSRL